MWKDLTNAISLLARTLSELVEQRKTEFDWLKSHAGLATKQDVRDSEERVIKAMGERVDPDAVTQLTKAADKLEKAVETNRAKISG